jgi:hypothetical protein
MILVPSRGGFCPKDRRQAEGLIELIGKWRLVTAAWSPSVLTTLMTTNEYRTGVAAHWTFLSCAGRKVQKDLEIAEYTDPMIPHTIVLEPGLMVFKIYLGYWYFGRATIEELRQDRRAVSRTCRSDWDITSPDMKAVWERGEKDRFYPYGKSYAKIFREQK